MASSRSPEHGRDEPTTPEGGVRPHPDSKEFKAWHQERDRKESLKFIIESGRAETPEEAEAHLETVNRLKERLLGFLQDVARDHRLNEERSDSPEVFYHKDFERVRAVPEDVITLLQPEDLDRTEPHLWYLDRVVFAKDQGVGFREALQLAMAEGPNILLVADNLGFTRRRLAKYFSEKEREFLMREYDFASQELARNLREAADEVTSGSWDRSFRERWVSLKPKNRGEEKP